MEKNNFVYSSNKKINYIKQVNCKYNKEQMLQDEQYLWFKDQSSFLPFDGRIIVKNQQQRMKSPFCSIGKLVSYFKLNDDVIPSFGTGAFISNRVIITAAHNFYNHDLKIQSFKSMFYPYCQKFQKVSQITGIEFQSIQFLQEYKNQQEKGYNRKRNDLAIGILKNHSILNDIRCLKINWNYSLLATRKSNNLQLPIMTIGYCKSHQNEQQNTPQESNNRLSYQLYPPYAQKEFFLHYLHTTQYGISGGPILFRNNQNEDYEIIAIHLGAVINSNIGILLNGFLSPKQNILELIDNGNFRQYVVLNIPQKSKNSLIKQNENLHLKMEQKDKLIKKQMMIIEQYQNIIQNQRKKIQKDQKEKMIIAQNQKIIKNQKRIIQKDQKEMMIIAQNQKIIQNKRRIIQQDQKVMKDLKEVIQEKQKVINNQKLQNKQTEASIKDYEIIEKIDELSEFCQLLKQNIDKLCQNPQNFDENQIRNKLKMIFYKSFIIQQKQINWINLQQYQSKSNNKQQTIKKINKINQINKMIQQSFQNTQKTLKEILQKIQKSIQKVHMNYQLDLKLIIVLILFAKQSECFVEYNPSLSQQQLQTIAKKVSQKWSNQVQQIGKLQFTKQKDFYKLYIFFKYLRDLITKFKQFNIFINHFPEKEFEQIIKKCFNKIKQINKKIQCIKFLCQFDIIREIQTNYIQWLLEQKINSLSLLKQQLLDQAIMYINSFYYIKLMVAEFQEILSKINNFNPFQLKELDLKDFVIKRLKQIQQKIENIAQFQFKKSIQKSQLKQIEQLKKQFNFMYKLHQQTKRQNQYQINFIETKKLIDRLLAPYSQDLESKLA